LVRHIVLSGAVAFFMAASSGQPQQQASSLPDGPRPAAQQPPQTIPDAPTPQALPGVGTITPGKGTTSGSSDSDAPDDFQQTAPGSSIPSTPVIHADDGAAPEIPVAGEGAKVFTITGRGVNFVEVPFTVKDSKNHLVSGLTWRDVRIYENNVRQQMVLWTVDPFPLSVALVIDQSVTPDTMAKINNSLGALQGAFSAYDEVAVFTYNNGPKQQDGFTAGQSARLGAVLERSKTSGRDATWTDTTGPLAQNIDVNNGAMASQMPLVNSTHGTSQSSNQIVPREIHTLNDAILAAAVATSKAGPGRRRIVYVISDGKEYGSVAKAKDVIKYLQTNKIAVYGTLVGDSGIPGLGFMDTIHLPLTMHDNILPQYAKATGGEIDPEFRQKGIEESFSKLTDDVRNQYTVGYNSHEAVLDDKFRTIEVKVLRPNLTVTAKKGYYPTATPISPPRPAPSAMP
jgi:VWFA-related protein